MPKGKTRHELTPEIHKRICALIRQGAYPHVAAETCFIPRDVFEKWMDVGCPVGKTRKKNGYTQFWLDVTQAAAHARYLAEAAALKDDPLAWLKHGPGKDRPDNPGWSSIVKASTVINNNVSLLHMPEFQGLFRSILEMLAPWPEARAAVAHALWKAESLESVPKVIEAISMKTISPPLDSGLPEKKESLPDLQKPSDN